MIIINTDMNSLSSVTSLSKTCVIMMHFRKIFTERKNRFSVCRLYYAPEERRESACSSPTPHLSLQEDRITRFIDQPLSALLGVERTSANINGRILGTFSDSRWRRQRGSGKKKDLRNRSIAQHMRFKTVYIS